MSDVDAPVAQRCFICGYDNPNGLHEHHIVPREYGGTDQPENLTWLCASCHQAVHKLYDARFFARLGAEGADESEPFDIDIEGESVPDEYALDREIPEASPHIRVRRSVTPVEGTGMDLSSDSDTDDEVVAHEDIAGREKVTELHCGYCPTVFEPCQHANLARHLRVKHGIEDVYGGEDALPTGFL